MSSMSTFGSKSKTPGQGGKAFEDYVSSTSRFSGARRMLEAVSAARDDYEGAWDALGRVEQAQALDDAVIRPEAALQYHQGQEGKPPLPLGVTQVFPRLRQRTGAAKRVVVEDAAGSQGEDLDSASSSGCVSILF